MERTNTKTGFPSYEKWKEQHKEEIKEIEQEKEKQIKELIRGLYQGDMDAYYWAKEY